MNNLDPYAGIGGSYIQQPDGTLKLVERTGATDEELGIKPEPPAPAKHSAPAKPESQP